MRNRESTTKADKTGALTIAQHRARMKYLQVEGARLAYLDEGPKGGKPVVLLHGFPTSSWLYRKVIPLLSTAGLRVIAPDFLGAGASDKPRELPEYEVTREATRIEVLLRHLNLPKVTLVVHDTGGLVGFQLIQQNPGVVDGLVIMNTSIYREDWDNPLARIALLPLVLQFVGFLFANRLTGPALVKWLFQYGTCSTEVWTDEAVQGYWLPMYEGAIYWFPGTMRDVLACRERLSQWQTTLRNLSCPACIIWGRKDPLFQAELLTSRFAQDLRISHEDIRIFDDASHFLQEDKPEDIAALITQFVYGGSTA